MSADRLVFDDCWFCGRRTYMGNLIAGYDTFDEQRLACDDCDRTLKALAARGYYFQRLRPDPDPRTVADDFEVERYTQLDDGDLFGDEPVPSSHHTRYLVLLALAVLGYLVVRNVR